MTANLASQTANTSTKLHIPMPATTQAPTIDNSPSMSRAQEDGNGDFTEPHHKSFNQISINADELYTSSPQMLRNLTSNDSLQQANQPLFTTPTNKSSSPAAEKPESHDEQEKVEQPMQNRNDKKRNFLKGEALRRLTTLQALPLIQQQVALKKRRAPIVQNARIRLNQAQRARLELSYLRNPNWSNEEIEDLANLIKIPFTKVYKWNWERKKKDRKQYTLYELASLYPEVGPCSE